MMDICLVIQGSRLRLIATLASLLALCACSDPSSNDGGGANLDDAQILSTLTDAQLGALCDWANQQQGGYGKEVKCASGGSVMTQKDQASCEAEDGPSLKKCSQTVSTYKACTLELAKDPCDTSKALATDACKPLIPCL